MKYIFIFYLGSIISSFLYCYCYRYINNESFVTDRSKCDVCKHKLSFINLIPIFSYVFNKGKCKYCGSKISVIYPLSEILLGLIFLLIYLRFGINIEYLLLSMIMFCISIIDYKTYIIPDRFIVMGIINRLLFINSINELYLCLTNSLIIVLPILILIFVMNRVLHKESMGLGDIKLFFMLGIYFSYYYNLIAILMSCLIGIIYIAISKKRVIPYGPAICLAYLSLILFI